MSFKYYNIEEKMQNDVLNENITDSTVIQYIITTRLRSKK